MNRIPLSVRDRTTVFGREVVSPQQEQVLLDVGASLPGVSDRDKGRGAAVCGSDFESGGVGGGVDRLGEIAREERGRARTAAQEGREESEKDACGRFHLHKSRKKSFRKVLVFEKYAIYLQSQNEGNMLRAGGIGA